MFSDSKPQKLGKRSRRSWRRLKEDIDSTAGKRRLVFLKEILETP